MRSIDGLAVSWSQISHIDAAALHDAQPKVLASLRSSMVRHNDQFLGSLAHLALGHLSDLHKAALQDASTSHPEAGDRLAGLAAMAGSTFGATVASIVLWGIAASDDPLAADVSARIGELRRVAADSSAHPRTPPPAEPPPAEPPPAEPPPAEPPPAEPQPAAAAPPTQPGARDLAAAEDLLQRTEELRQQGAQLAEVLRAAASDAAAGIPVTATVADTLLSWSAAADEHLVSTADLGPAPDLAALEECLADLIDQSRKDGQKRRDALLGAQVLLDQGLDHLVPGMLKAQGFESLAELQAAVGAGHADSAPAADVPDPVVEPPEAPVVETSEAPVAGFPEFAVTEPPEARVIEFPEFPVTEPPEVRVVKPPKVRVFEFPEFPVAELSQVRAADLPEFPEFPVADSPAVAPTSPAEGQPAPPDVADDEPINYPWDVGSPPLITSLIMADREILAVCVAEAAQETAVRQRVIKFFCAAYGCAPAMLELQLPDLTPMDTEVGQMTPDECRVVISAALRAGLSLGYSPLGLPLLIERAELSDGASRAIIDTAAEAVRRGYRHAIEPGIQYADLPGRWAAFQPEASHLRESLEQGTVALQRASRVLHHIARQDQPVGQALELVSKLASEGIGSATSDAGKESWSQIDRIAADLSSPAKRARIIQEAVKAVSTGSQLRKDIIGPAHLRLDGSLRKAGDLLVRFMSVRSDIRLSSRTSDLATAGQLADVLARRPAGSDISSVGDAALERLFQWLPIGTPAASTASVDECVRAELEPLHEIPRDEEGVLARPPDLAEVRDLVEGRNPAQVIRGYLESGNIAAAREIIAPYELASRTALDDEILRGAQQARKRHQDALAEVDRTAARLRALYEDTAARDLTVRAQSLRQPPEGRFDLVIDPLLALAAEGAERLRKFCDDLRERVESSSCAADDRQRIIDLITGEDEILALEFLAMAEAGRPLPAAEEQHEDDFSSFFPSMVNAAIAAAQHGDDPINAVRRLAGKRTSPASGPVNRQLAAGLDAWRELKKNKRKSGDSFRLYVANVLRMLGLVPRAQNWLQELSVTQRSGYATFKVKAAPVDRSYVPSLGTQAHNTYDLTIVWDSVTPTRLMDFIEDRRRTEPNIIVYFGILDPAQRLALRRLTSHSGGKGFSPLVIDEPVAAWLSTRPEPGWRFTQRVTLPFTTLNPYTPFAGGEVPDEVFVGREAERQAIESPTGSMFVYGGRQLGKSALLRRVERLFTEPLPPPSVGPWAPRAGRVAVYLDLKAASVGEAQEPAALWTVLAQRLKDANVLSPKTSQGISAGEVTRQLSQWLSSDDANRLLLLLDEADNFLTADFQSGQVGRGVEFPTLQRLKDLMERSERRFKPVFAGLHQVQRFHDTSNTPVAHGGDDILIGPLRSMDAYRLVVDPMTALGYKFPSPELVWRLLLFTNYQAALVQIVCEALVREMQDRKLSEEGGRILITSADVDAVCTKKEVRDLIAQRFRWTINLDNRYRVIALVVALRSLDSDPGEAFSAEELHDECEVFWPVGFTRSVLTSKEFRRHLEEMVGLGVLHCQNEDYGLRSPNIIGLLGTRESLNQELAEASKHLELQYEYNPTMNRRIIGQSTELWAPRSPLTDHDIASLLGNGNGGSPARQVEVVTGSIALTVERVAQVIRDVATEKGLSCTLVRPEQLDAQLANGPVRGHMVVDLAGSSISPPELLVLCEKLRARRPRLTSTVVVGPGVLPLPRNLFGAEEIFVTRRWSIEGLRSWHESPFHTPELRARLHRVTSGWPRLVEETMREIDSGKSPDKALEQISGLLSERKFAGEHLADCGIDQQLAFKWVTWQSDRGSDGLIEALPASLTDLNEALETDASQAIERLESLDLVESTEKGWVLDRAVVHAAVTLQE